MARNGVAASKKKSVDGTRCHHTRGRGLAMRDRCHCRTGAEGRCARRNSPAWGLMRSTLPFVDGRRASSCSERMHVLGTRYGAIRAVTLGKGSQPVGGTRPERDRTTGKPPRAAVDVRKATRSRRVDRSRALDLVVEAPRHSLAVLVETPSHCAIVMVALRAMRIWMKRWRELGWGR